MRVALLRKLGIGVAHEPRLAGAQHHLEVRALEAHVLESVDDVGGAGDAVPLAEHKSDNAVILLAAVNDGKVSLCAGVSKALT